MIHRLFLVCLLCLFVSPSLAEDKVLTIAPHKATYTMALAKAKAGSGVSKVSGQMVFDWQDACEGWAIQQNMQLKFLYTEGEETQVSSPALTWEAKDGKLFTFHVRRVVGEQEEDAFKGRVTRDEKGRSVAHYTTPLNKKDVDVDAKTIFPTAHTLMILQKAAAGEKMFTQRVFDGADAAGHVDISAFIGARIDNLDDSALAPELRGNSLLTKTAWPVRLAFYKTDSDGSEPDYEMEFLLQSNGVARSMTVDYGDFMISGTLGSLEVGEPLACAGETKAP